MAIVAMEASFLMQQWVWRKSQCLLQDPEARAVLRPPVFFLFLLLRGGQEAQRRAVRTSRSLAVAGVQTACKVSHPPPPPGQIREDSEYKGLQGEVSKVRTSGQTKVRPMGTTSCSILSLKQTFNTGVDRLRSCEGNSFAC